MQHRLICALALLISAAASAQSIEDARKDYEQGAYRQSLKTISQAMAASADKLSPDAEYAMLMLRGENFLRLNERSSAIDAFTDASEAVTATDQVAVAKATALLAKRSRNGVFTPSGSSREIDIFTPQSRKQAFAALFADMHSEYSPKIDAARQATTLPPLMAVVPQLGELYSLEFSAQGNATQSLALFRAVGTHGRELIERELQKIARRLQTLQQQANDVVDLGRRDGYARRGLISTEKQELQKTADYLEQIKAVAVQARKVATRLGQPDSKWADIIAQVCTLQDQASNLAIRQE